jgi:hypothetical protein
MLDIGLRQPVVTYNKIKLTDHSIQRIRERLNIKDTTYALNFVKDIIKNGEYLGEHFGGSPNDESELCSMFVAKGIMVIVNSKMEVVTVMKKEDHTYFHDRLRNQYIKLGTKEIRKLNRREQTLHKRLEEYQLEYDVQMALLNKRMYKTRSNNVRKVCKTEKKQLNSSLNTLKQQIRDVQLEKRKVAYSLSVFL